MRGRKCAYIISGSLLLILSTPHVQAQIPISPNYRLEESTFDAGGSVQSSSPNFQSTSAISDNAVGESQSTNYQTALGARTEPDPVLSVVIDSYSADFGKFTASSASTATASFTVLNYTSYGYAVQINGSPPSNGANSLQAMTSTNSPQIGVEQFGINLVANTSPTSFGANPDNGQFGFGQAAPNYSIPNKFRYVSGETIASAPKSSGVTRYTVSYLVNVAGLTPGGNYSSDQTLVITGTY